MAKDLKFASTECIGKNWQEEYNKKLVSAETAAKAVKSGDRVIFYQGGRLLGPALAARKNELRNVIIHSCVPQQPHVGPFYQLDAQKAFTNTIEFFTGDFARMAPAGTDAKYTQFIPGLMSLLLKPFDERPEECPYTIDVVITSASRPDKNGFCSFGAGLWQKRAYCKRAGTVIIEVGQTDIRAGGTGFIHVSEVDYFVDAPTPLLSDKLKEELLARTAPEVRKLVEPIIPQIEKGRQLPIVEAFSKADLETAKIILGTLWAQGDPPPEAPAIARYVSEIVRDGDTIQIGVGLPSIWICKLGAFDNKRDLGIYTEFGWPGLGKMVQKGIVTGRYKTVHPGRVTASSFGGCDGEDLEIIDGNPVFELYDGEYLLDIRNASQNDNFVTINNAISIDLTGQINSETGVGSRLINAHGGQPDLHIAAVLSKGGRAVTLLRSTALNGAISSIVPQLDQGALVTIPRYFADYVVTEYGIARLMGRDCRQRAEQLIAIAHPDFRAKLREEAEKLFYP
ncbi:MAG: hypothetical protein HY663_00150 [Chloroflexi bacterium]|nr:hypothetical protein [Chloroflexota bacterium]